MRDPAWLASHTQYGGVQNDPPKIRIGMQVLNRLSMVFWIVQCFTSPPTQYRLYGRRILQVKRPNQQYQSTEGSYKWKQKQHREHNTHIHTYEVVHAKKIRIYNTASPLVYSNMGWLWDGSHRGQVCQAWTSVGLTPVNGNFCSGTHRLATYNTRDYNDTRQTDTTV